jgi:hypothetical protein
VVAGLLFAVVGGAGDEEVVVADGNVIDCKCHSRLGNIESTLFKMKKEI